MFRPFEQDAAPVGWRVRVAMLTADLSQEREVMSRRIAGLGGSVEHFDEMFSAISAMMDDPTGYGLLVMDCDAFGGPEVGHRAVALLRGTGSTVPVILISHECSESVFPEDYAMPILLRSAVSLQAAFDHAMRGRLHWHAA
ncbi:MAG: hypothetical protein LBE86_04530 [Gemmobacter sp.]|nr:hypothetical protein [Gemmobacter sp.]